MTEFLFIAVLMMAACLAIVLVPLWRGHTPTTDRRRAANIEIYRQRCAEIDRDVVGGQLANSEAEIEKQRLGARLLDDVSAADAGPVESDTSGRPWLATILLAGVIVFGGAGTYAVFGDWQAINRAGLPNIEQMIDQFNAVVAANPDNRKARLLLAQLYQHQQDNTKAADALRYINQHDAPAEPGLLTAEAELRLAAGETLSGRPKQLFKRVLSADPDNQTALWQLGLGAAEDNDSAQAIQYWTRLLEQPLAPPARTTIQNRVDMLKNAQSKPLSADRRTQPARPAAFLLITGHKIANSKAAPGMYDQGLQRSWLLSYAAVQEPLTPAYTGHSSAQG